MRLRSVSLSYEFPKTWLSKIGFVKRASVSVAATNLLLITNYDGDPEVAAAGAGVGGSSSVGFDYCGVPASSTMSFGLILTFKLLKNSSNMKLFKSMILCSVGALITLFSGCSDWLDVNVAPENPTAGYATYDSRLAHFEFYTNSATLFAACCSSMSMGDRTRF